MTVFYLVRHAHAVWTPDENRPLSERGRKETQRVTEALRSRPIVAIYASPAHRAQQTVAPLAAQLGLEVHISPELAERRLCAGAVNDFLSAVRATWEDFSFAHPGGETNAAAQRRGVSLVDELIDRHSGEHIILATHGILLALLLRHYAGRMAELPHVSPGVAFDFCFWRSLAMPDLYQLETGSNREVTIEHLFEQGRRKPHRGPATRPLDPAAAERCARL